MPVAFGRKLSIGKIQDSDSNKPTTILSFIEKKFTEYWRKAWAIQQFFKINRA